MTSFLALQLATEEELRAGVLGDGLKKPSWWMSRMAGRGEARRMIEAGSISPRPCR